MTQKLSTLPASRTLSTARHLVVSAGAAAVLLTAMTGISGHSPAAPVSPAVLAAFDSAAPGIQAASDPTMAHADPVTGLEQYSEVAQNSGGALGDYLKTVENMEPALKATPGDFARQTSALDAAHTAMVQAALRKDDEPAVEEQGRSAIQQANEAINAQGKVDAYTDSLVNTGAFERQWGRKRDQRPSAPATSP